MNETDSGMMWVFGGLIVGGAVFFASRLVLGTGWLWWLTMFPAWVAIASAGILKGASR